MKRRSSLAIVTILVLLTLSCNFLGGGEEEGAEATPPPTEPALPEAESPRVRPADGMPMVHVPAGEFLMGDDTSPFASEKPAHTVYLDEYWIDRYEVTNAQYGLCVDAGACAEPQSWEDSNLNGDPQPALVVWEAAQAYCHWGEGRLATEAEWEKAARGTDGRKWPWGNEFDPSLANLNGDEDGYEFTAPVGSFPRGASPYDLMDVAGNAAEWVSDWYDPEYYAESPTHNPAGPASGEQRLVRGTLANGGGGPEKCRCVARFPNDPVRWEFGFRCVSNTPPEE
jgi:formylglycine-generating enzyme required for sulfatase activity